MEFFSFIKAHFYISTKTDGLYLQQKQLILTDTHTHLYSEQFDDDRSEVIQKAIDAGIKRFFIPAIDRRFLSGHV